MSLVHSHHNWWEQTDSSEVGTFYKNWIKHVKILTLCVFLKFFDHKIAKILWGGIWIMNRRNISVQQMNYTKSPSQFFACIHKLQASLIHNMRQSMKLKGINNLRRYCNVMNIWWMYSMNNKFVMFGPSVSNVVLCAPSVPQPVSQSRWRPLLGPSPGWKRLLALSHLRHY